MYVKLLASAWSEMIKYLSCASFLKTLKALSPPRESLNQACVRDGAVTSHKTFPTLLHSAVPQRLASQDHLSVGADGNLGRSQRPEEAGRHLPLPIAHYQWTAFLCHIHSLSLFSLVPDLVCKHLSWPSSLAHTFIRCPFIEECVCLLLGPQHTLGPFEALLSFHWTVGSPLRAGTT